MIFFSTKHITGLIYNSLVYHIVFILNPFRFPENEYLWSYGSYILYCRQFHIMNMGTKPKSSAYAGKMVYLPVSILLPISMQAYSFNSLCVIMLCGDVANINEVHSNFPHIPFLPDLIFPISIPFHKTSMVALNSKVQTVYYCLS